MNNVESGTNLQLELYPGLNMLVLRVIIFTFYLSIFINKRKDFGDRLIILLS